MKTKTFWSYFLIALVFYSLSVHGKTRDGYSFIFSCTEDAASKTDTALHLSCRDNNVDFDFSIVFNKPTGIIDKIMSSSAFWDGDDEAQYTINCRANYSSYVSQEAAYETLKNSLSNIIPVTSRPTPTLGFNVDQDALSVSCDLIHNEQTVFNDDAYKYVVSVGQKIVEPMTSTIIEFDGQLERENLDAREGFNEISKDVVWGFDAEEDLYNTTPITYLMDPARFHFTEGEYRILMIWMKTVRGSDRMTYVELGRLAAKSSNPSIKKLSGKLLAADIIQAKSTRSKTLKEAWVLFTKFNIIIEQQYLQMLYSSAWPNSVNPIERHHVTFVYFLGAVRMNQQDAYLEDLVSETRRTNVLNPDQLKHFIRDKILASTFKDSDRRMVHYALRIISRMDAMVQSIYFFHEKINTITEVASRVSLLEQTLSGYSVRDQKDIIDAISKPIFYLTNDNLYAIDVGPGRKAIEDFCKVLDAGDPKKVAAWLIDKTHKSDPTPLLERMEIDLVARWLQQEKSTQDQEQSRTTLAQEAAAQRRLPALDGVQKASWSSLTQGWSDNDRLIARYFLALWDLDIANGFNLALAKRDAVLAQKFLVRCLKEVSSIAASPEQREFAQRLVNGLSKIKEDRHGAAPADVSQAPTSSPTGVESWVVKVPNNFQTKFKKLPIEVQNVYLNEFIPMMRTGGLLDFNMQRRWKLEKYKNSNFFYAELDYVWRVHYVYDALKKEILILEIENHHP